MQIVDRDFDAPLPAEILAGFLGIDDEATP